MVPSKIPTRVAPWLGNRGCSPKLRPEGEETGRGSGRVRREVLLQGRAMLVCVTQFSPPRPRRGRGFGIAATVVALVGILPNGIVWILAGTVDPNYGWLLFVTLPWAVLMGAIAGVLGIIGITLARSEPGGYGWPVVGLVLGALQLLPAVVFLTGV